MDAIFYYLFKSTVWISSFAIIYFTFLRNERFFNMNRYYLLLGIFSAFVFPSITFKYFVTLPKTNLNLVNHTSNTIYSLTKEGNVFLSLQEIAFIIYVIGIVFSAIRKVWQVVKILFLISKSEVYKTESHWLVETVHVKYSFSFFNYILINPSIDKIEKQEIVKHELGHISQKHWFDLLCLEFLQIIQWFNPVIWLYGRMTRQNHEYLADRYTLENTCNSAVYKATLLNQLMGGSVITLTNSFNYSLNQKRFNMMKNYKQSSIRKFKFVFILPLIACIFYAFSEPYYEKDKSKNDLIKTQVSNVLTNVQNSNNENQIVVGSISWKNNKVFPSKKLTEKLGIKSGDVLTKNDIDIKLGNIIHGLYFDHGYAFANINLNQSNNKNGSTDIVLEVDEGTKCYFGKISFNGETNITVEELKNVVKVSEGALFSSSKLTESINALNNYLNNDSITLDAIPMINDTNSTIDIVFNF